MRFSFYNYGKYTSYLGWCSGLIELVLQTKTISDFDSELLRSLCVLRAPGHYHRLDGYARCREGIIGADGCALHRLISDDQGLPKAPRT